MKSLGAAFKKLLLKSAFRWQCLFLLHRVVLTFESFKTLIKPDHFKQSYSVALSNVDTGAVFFILLFVEG